MAIKILIWDLDETFWKGTLSEGKVFPIEKNIVLVKELADRGIMNSIVSKNDYDRAMEVLKDWGVAQYFIFPHISWNPKGNEVKALLNECNLRAENTMFVDDNPSNLEEVKYYNPGIVCIEPVFLAENDILSMEEFRGKEDKEHSRLAQYHVLEERTEKRGAFSSNEEFLRASHIQIEINRKLGSNLVRIEELIQRTNQLNYTKNRMSLPELEELIQQPNTEAAYIRAKDDFGDYGIVGFYLMQEKRLIHFLFSCRILGFGIENYIWKKLGYPRIDVVGEIATVLEETKEIDWIVEKTFDEKALRDDEQTNSPKLESKENKERLLLIGGCDLGQASLYLESSFEVRKEFNTVVNGHEIRTSDTSQLVHAKELDVFLREELCEKIPFFDKKITYATELYSGKYKVIVISLVDDFIRGVYKRNDGDYCITFGTYWNTEDDVKDNFSKNEIAYFEDNFTFIGREEPAYFKSNIEKIIDGVGKSKLLLINGIELDVSDWIGEDRCMRNREMNYVNDQVILEHPEVGLIDMRKIVTERRQLSKHDNRHFERKCYFQIAQEIIKQTADSFSPKGIQTKSMFSVSVEELIKKIQRKIGKWAGNRPT